MWKQLTSKNKSSVDGIAPQKTPELTLNSEDIFLAKQVKGAQW